MEQMVTLRMPKKDMEALLRVMEDMKFFKEAEEGSEQIKKGKYITLEDLERKHHL